MRIFILGYKSTGKTTVGKKLASRLNLNFIDLDDYIETINNKTVPEIFSEDGEEVFRKKEWEALVKICNEETNVVVSTGGGAPCWCDNMNLMLQKGETIYLQIDNNTLVGRLKKAALTRPIVMGKTSDELHEYVRDLKNRCEHHYLRAKYHIDVNGLSVNNLVNLIERTIITGIK